MLEPGTEMRRRPSLHDEGEELERQVNAARVVSPALSHAASSKAISNQFHIDFKLLNLTSNLAVPLLVSN